MLHLFTLAGDHLAFDSESGALHQIDAVAAAVLSAYAKVEGLRPQAAAIARLEKKHGAEVHACMAEIDSLIAAGELFAPPIAVSPQQLYPDGAHIKSMCLHLCHDCNLRCRYCFATTGDFGTGRRSMLSLKTGRKAIDFLIAAAGPRKHLDLDFFGGEPLLNWPVVVDLVRYCQLRSEQTGKVLRLTLTTNATRLDDEKIAFINEHFKNVVLSIDGRPQVHDRMRPDAADRGSYAESAAGIRRLVAARGGMTHYLRGTYTSHNLDFDADARHLATLSPHVSLEPVVAAATEPYALRRKDLPRITASYVRLAQDYVKARQEGHPFNFFHFQLDLQKGPCAYKRLKGCGVGMEYCAVTPEGDIYPCHQFVGLPQFRMGNVLDEPVQLSESVRRPFEKLLLPDKPACQTCWARWFCSGGCAANAWHESGRVDGLHEFGCELMKIRLECALWIKAALAKGGA